MKPSTTKKPWGSFIRFTLNEPSTVKLLFVNRGEELSLQYHAHRQEFWHVLKGNPDIIVDDKPQSPHEGDEIAIAPYVDHRISAPRDDVTILEVSTGVFDEEDIVRLDDKYNRL